MGDLFEWKGYALCLGCFLFSVLLFFHYSDDFYYSFVGAIFSAAMVWGSYLIIRVMVIAAR